MLFHLSIDADDPMRVAHVLAELWDGLAMPFPPVIDGSWITFADDGRGTAIEIYPRGTEIHEGELACDAYGVLGSNRSRSSTHFAMATVLDEAQVIAIARREGWPVKVCIRGGMFGVIEIFVEGSRMIEVLTPTMQARYLETMTIDNWKKVLDAGPPLSRAA